MSVLPFRRLIVLPDNLAASELVAAMTPHLEKYFADLEAVRETTPGPGIETIVMTVRLKPEIVEAMMADGFIVEHRAATAEEMAAGVPIDD